MSYQLKTTGIAASCTMCVAVDPDTGTIKDFSSAAVTSTIQVDAGITIAAQPWAGTARSYFKLAANQFVSFGANKPLFDISATATQKSVVWIGEAAGSSVRAFGNDSANYFASVNLGAGGSNCPFIQMAANSLNGLRPPLAAGNKAIFGFSMNRGVEHSAYIGLDTDAQLTKVTLGSTALTSTYSMQGIGRRWDSTTQQNDKIHAVLIFNTALSDADWESLRANWFDVLLEPAASTGVLEAAATGSVTASASASLTLDAPAPLAVISEPLTDNTGNVQANVPLVYVSVYDPATGALVARQSGLVTDATGRYTVTDPALQPGISYLHDWLTVTGARRMPVKAAQ